MKLQKTNKVVRKLISVALSANLLLSVVACKNTTAPSTDTPESSTQSPAEQQPQNQVQQPQSQDDITENPNDTIYKTKITYSAIIGDHITGGVCENGFRLETVPSGNEYAIPDDTNLYIQFLKEETSENGTIGTFEIIAKERYYIDDSDPDHITAIVIG